MKPSSRWRGENAGRGGSMLLSRRGVVLLLLCATGCEGALDVRASRQAAPRRAVQRRAEQRLGTRWQASSTRWQAAPTLRSIEAPPIELENAIWGSTGRDDRGNLYFGVSCEGQGRPAATLCRLAPGSDRVENLGDALTELHKHGLADEKTSQVKIHGKPVQADDGWIYFTSTDEQGEAEDGSALPLFWSHLWRIEPEINKWEHVLAAPEGLIATACAGRYVYAMGYFNHVVIQYDTLTRTVRRTTVGSVGGHVSRNVLVDLDEHVYVPRVERSEDGGFSVELLELDTDLKVVGKQPLEDYGATADFRSHGIVGFAALATDGLVFVTAKGALYRLTPHTGGPATLRRLGWLHPDGESYSAFLACPDGRRTLCGISRLSNTRPYEWVTYDLESNSGAVLALDETSQALLDRKSLLVYGSNTLDDEGNAFAVGRWAEMADGGLRPYILQVRWPTPPATPEQRDKAHDPATR